MTRAKQSALQSTQSMLSKPAGPPSTTSRQTPLQSSVTRPPPPARSPSRATHRGPGHRPVPNATRHRAPHQHHDQPRNPPHGLHRPRPPGAMIHKPQSHVRPQSPGSAVISKGIRGRGIGMREEGEAG
ncbi:unnamed protein product [Pleuronectes platessa]|uniref:Uncharacterized protein n=1 Tax=Pleuronectes platessa TaxID=8262 RepID=A0A9N7URS4_PLEPL|nr:unnamed protein product [Pleuronectes platessa]